MLSNGGEGDVSKLRRNLVTTSYTITYWKQTEVRKTKKNRTSTFFANRALLDPTQLHTQQRTDRSVYGVIRLQRTVRTRWRRQLILHSLQVCAIIMVVNHRVDGGGHDPHLLELERTILRCKISWNGLQWPIQRGSVGRPSPIGLRFFFSKSPSPV